MKLRLDLEGIDASLEINNYHPSTQEKWDEEWCEVSFSITSGSWLNYGKLDNQILLCSEVEELRDMLKKLLLDEVSESAELSFIEPDFVFDITPKRIEQQLSMFDEFPKVYSAFVDWKIYFWSDGLTSNYLNLCLCEEDIEHLKNYLNLVTGVVDKSNPVIQDMINKSILSD